MLLWVRDSLIGIGRLRITQPMRAPLHGLECYRVHRAGWKCEASNEGRTSDRHWTRGGSLIRGPAVRCGTHRADMEDRLISPRGSCCKAHQWTSPRVGAATIREKGSDEGSVALRFAQETESVSGGVFSGI